MGKKKWIFLIMVVAMLPFLTVLPSVACESDVSDISLQPGANPSQLNITWHAGDAVAGDTCSVKVTKDPFKWKGAYWFFCHFPGFTRIFEGTWMDAGLDEYGNSDAYCKVTVDGLKNWEKYTYRVSDGTGDWSDSYKYNPSNYNKYGFLFVGDPQIGASGPKDLSRSRDLQPYVEEYYETNDLPEGKKVDDIYALVKTEYTEEGRETDFASLIGLDDTLRTELLTLIEDRIEEMMAATDEDAEGWGTTVDLMTAMFPRASFIVSAGDQVEMGDAEWEYTGFLSPDKFRSMPVAPTMAAHDSDLNFEYHFNLPNESNEYGQDSNGVGDYYFTHGNTLVMVLNMDVAYDLFPTEGPSGPPPGGGALPPGGGGPPPDADGDGVFDFNDLCPDTPAGTFVDDEGCALLDGEDYDDDGILNKYDMCSNSVEEHILAGLINNGTGGDGCPYPENDIDSDGIPDMDAEGVTIDRCTNTYDDLTVDENGCADCRYLETDDELRNWLAGLEADGDLDEFNAALAEHQAFVTEAVEANPFAKWKIVVWHYSIYSTASHSADDRSEGLRYLFTPTLEDLGIDVVLMGHDHVYTRTHQMLDNEPQLDQKVGYRGQVINPTGVLYLTASSSSGSKYYELNCNIGDETSDSAGYYDYAAIYEEYMPTFTYFNVNGNFLKLSTYTYLEVEDEEGVGTGEFDVTLIDEYAIEKRPHFRWWGK